MNDFFRYTSDDRDNDPQDLIIMIGGNGDYYISVAPEGCFTSKAVRISTSGGCASANPRLLLAVAAMYRALAGIEDPDPRFEQLWKDLQEIE